MDVLQDHTACCTSSSLWDIRWTKRSHQSTIPWRPGLDSRSWNLQLQFTIIIYSMCTNFIKRCNQTKLKRTTPSSSSHFSSSLYICIRNWKPSALRWQNHVLNCWSTKLLSLLCRQVSTLWSNFNQTRCTSSMLSHTLQLDLRLRTRALWRRRLQVVDLLLSTTLQ